MQYDIKLLKLSHISIDCMYKTITCILTAHYLLRYLKSNRIIYLRFMWKNVHNNNYNKNGMNEKDTRKEIRQFDK